MNRIIKITVIVLIFSCLAMTPIKCNCYEREGHDRLLEDIILGNMWNAVIAGGNSAATENKAKNNLKALNSAAYLAIDQFNGNGGKDLNYLKEFGVKGLPSNISEIDIIGSGTTHRSYTHRGWNYNYGLNMKDKWPKRQNILRNTVNAVFQGKGTEIQRECIAELIYYIHIIGDHLDDRTYMMNNGLKMEVGGRIGQNEDIICNIVACCEKLFVNTNNTHKYTGLMAGLKSLDSKFAEIVRSEGGVNSEEKFKLHQQYTDELKRWLSCNLPEMLMELPFFYDAFYK